VSRVSHDSGPRLEASCRTRNNFPSLTTRSCQIRQLYVKWCQHYIEDRQIDHCISCHYFQFLFTQLQAIFPMLTPGKIWFQKVSPKQPLALDFSGQMPFLLHQSNKGYLIDGCITKYFMTCTFKIALCLATKSIRNAQSSNITVKQYNRFVNIATPSHYHDMTALI